MRYPTREEVQAYREETGEGIMWCREQLNKQAARDAVRNLPPKDDETFDEELKQILMYMLR